MPLARQGSLSSGTPRSFSTRLLSARRTRQPSGGGSRETDCDEGAALKRSGRVKELEEGTESILTHAPVSFAASAGFEHHTGTYSQLDEIAPASARPFPLFPIVEPHASPDPVVDLEHSPAGVADAKVVHKVDELINALRR